MVEAEGRQQAENIIPAHWSFPERNLSGLKISQIDIREGFLAFGFDNPTSTTPKNVDIFFDQEGKQLYISKIGFRI